MTTSSTGDDDSAEATETAPPTDSDTVEESTPATPTRRPWKWVAAVLVAAAIGGGAFGFTKYQQVNHELAQVRQSQADRDAAAKLARDYALKSLTYSFEDPDAFFKSVEDRGVATAQGQVRQRHRPAEEHHAASASQLDR